MHMIEVMLRQKQPKKKDCKAGNEIYAIQLYRNKTWVSTTMNTGFITILRNRGQHVPLAQRAKTIALREKRVNAAGMKYVLAWKFTDGRQSRYKVIETDNTGCLRLTYSKSVLIVLNLLKRFFTGSSNGCRGSYSYSFRFPDLAIIQSTRFRRLFAVIVVGARLPYRWWWCFFLNIRRCLSSRRACDFRRNCEIRVRVLRDLIEHVSRDPRSSAELSWKSWSDAWCLP